MWHATQMVQLSLVIAVLCLLFPVQAAWIWAMLLLLAWLSARRW